MSNCPYCQNHVGHLVLSTLKASALGHSAVNCVALSCQHCQTVLGVGPDPTSLVIDTAQEVMRRLQQGR